MRKITDTSKQILSIIIKNVVQNGDFLIFIHYSNLMHECTIDDDNFLKICMKYIYESGYLKLIRKDDDDTRFVELTPKGINFVEVE